MTRRRYKQGIDRAQSYLLPPRVEDYVGEDNPVRAIESYVESLNLVEKGFKHADGAMTVGQPAYDPRMHLKLYLYGYLHRVRSSRRLEAECRRNLEVIWLVAGQQPSYKTIADFRKDNLKAIKKVNQDFVQVCKELELFGKELVAIDGSFMRGNVGKDSIYTAERLKRSLEHIDADIAGYLQELEQGDQHDQEGRQSDPELQEKLAKLRQLQQKRQEQQQQLQASGASQVAEVDEDARLLSKRGKGTIAGYNVQVAVDSKYKLLATADAVQDGNDQQQMLPMGQAAKEALGVEHLTSTQDAGYFNAQQIKECEEVGITPYVPEPDKQANTRQQGRFTRDDFQYQPAYHTYRCPHQQELKYSSTQHKGEKVIFQFRSLASVCATCPLKAQCLPKKNPYRVVTRWEHEALVEDHRQRMANDGPARMRQRASIVEHVFGTLKQWCGWTHFLLRGLEKVRAELSLLMLAYNFKRVLNIVGLQVFQAYCIHRQQQITSSRR
jgi:transposase